VRSVDIFVHKLDGEMENSVEERFLTKVRWTEGWCPWTWIGCGNVYGQLRVDDKMRFAHKIAYELFVGPIPEGMLVLHDCDNPLCVWPGHLHLGTYSDNAKEAYERGRSSQTGEDNTFHKLTEEDVIVIRRSNESSRRLAKQFGVDKSTILRVKSGEAWSHVVGKSRQQILNDL
jgi:HNH endonuclease